MQIPESVRNSIEGVRLPAMPQVLLRFLDMVEDDRVSLPELATLVGQDPALTARLLAVANSPALRRNQEVKNLVDCMTAVGTRLARTIAECLAIEAGFARAEGEPDCDLGGIWRHCLRVAEMARAVAASTKLTDGDDAYLAGLLHDVGQLLLLGGTGERYAGFLQNIGSEAKLRDVEELLFGTDHAAIGAWLVDQWQLSSFLSDAILFHHKSADEIADADPLSKIVWCCHAIDAVGPPDLSADPGAPVLATVSSLLGLDHADLLAIYRQSADRVDGLAATLCIPEDDAANGERQRPALPERRLAHTEVEVRVREMAIMQSLQRNLSTLRREEELLLAVHESARILFGIGRLAFFFPAADEPVLVSPTFAGQPALLKQLEIRLDRGRSLAVAAVTDRLPRCTFDSDQQAPVSLADVQVARALNSDGVLYIPLGMGARPTGVMACGIARSQHARLVKLLPRITRFAQQVAASIESWRELRASEEAIANGLTSRFQQHARRVVHEAGNPLGIIKNYLAIVSQKLGADNGAVQELQVLREEVDRVAHILQRLGDLTESAPPPETVDVNGMINGLLALYGESLFSSRGIIVEKQLAPALLPITGNRDSIKQILFNLWKNAADALAEGDRFFISTADNVVLNGRFYVEISLSDSGPGLPPDIMQRLFQPLETRRRPGHSGIGLSIVASLVESLDGVIKCRSNAGTGTSFFILLPRNQEHGVGQ